MCCSFEKGSTPWRYGNIKCHDYGLIFSTLSDYVESGLIIGRHIDQMVCFPGSERTVP